MNYLRIYNISFNILADKEAVKGYVVSSRRFHNNNRLSQGFKQIKKLSETFTTGRITARRDNFSILIKDTEMKVVLGDINAYEVFHNVISFFCSFRSLTPSSHVAGALIAQPTYWELRDRGTDSFGGFEAYKLWSPCPSLILLTISSMPLAYSLIYISILNKIYCRRRL